MENDNRWIIRLSGTAETEVGSAQAAVDGQAAAQTVSISGIL